MPTQFSQCTYHLSFKVIFCEKWSRFFPNYHKERIANYQQGGIFLHTSNALTLDSQRTQLQILVVIPLQL